MGLGGKAPPFCHQKNRKKQNMKGKTDQKSLKTPGPNAQRGAWNAFHQSGQARIFSRKSNTEGGSTDKKSAPALRNRSVNDTSPTTLPRNPTCFPIAAERKFPDACAQSRSIGSGLRRKSSPTAGFFRSAAKRYCKRASVENTKKSASGIKASLKIAADGISINSPSGTFPSKTAFSPHAKAPWRVSPPPPSLPSAKAAGQAPKPPREVRREAGA